MIDEKIIHFTALVKFFRPQLGLENPDKLQLEQFLSIFPAQYTCCDVESALVIQVCLCNWASVANQSNSSALNQCNCRDVLMEHSGTDGSTQGTIMDSTESLSPVCYLPTRPESVSSR